MLEKKAEAASERMLGGRKPPSKLVEASLADSIAQAVDALASRPKAAPETAPAAAAVAPERRNDGDAVMSARERYLARKRQREQEGGA